MSTNVVSYGREHETRVGASTGGILLSLPFAETWSTDVHNFIPVSTSEGNVTKRPGKIKKRGATIGARSEIKNTTIKVIAKNHGTETTGNDGNCPKGNRMGGAKIKACNVHTIAFASGVHKTNL